jgi:tetratricopeptide (TPR) repeat protein
MVNQMRAIVGLLSLVSALVLCGACSKSAPSGANGNGGATSVVASSGTNNSSGAQNNSGGDGSGGQGFDTAKMDAEIAQLEQQAEKNPDDDTALDALADAYVRRGRALHEAHRLNEALHDYQSALRFSPDHEEANLRIAQITQEIGAEPHAEDGKPVAVPAKPGANEHQQ